MDLKKLNKWIYIILVLSIIFVGGMLFGAYHSEKALEKVANENLKLRNENMRLKNNLNDLDELQAKLTKKVAELEGVGG
jgi:hypothetical protein